MNINHVGMSKNSLKILDALDGFIASFEKAKGVKPERVALKKKDYDSVYKSATREIKVDKPKRIYRAGVLVYPV